MLDETSREDASAAKRAPHHATASRRPARAQESAVKSATRALEIIELFAVHRHPLSVSEIAGALAIPQSSSSVLLQAMSGAGFIARDRQTRKYLPSIRSVFLGNWIHDSLYRHGSLLRALDALSEAAGANVRIGLRNGIHVQYVHVSWPGTEPDADRLSPGMKMPICHDALGRMLLLGEGDADVCGIARHANAADHASRPVSVDGLVQELRRHREDGFAILPDLTVESDVVLAVQLPAPIGAPAAIGLGLGAGRVPVERDRLVGLLMEFASEAWTSDREAEPHHEYDIAPARGFAD